MDGPIDQNEERPRCDWSTNTNHDAAFWLRYLKLLSAIWTLWIPDEPLLASGVRRDRATEGKKVTRRQRRRKTRADAQEGRRQAADERESGVTERLKMGWKKEEETGKSR